MQYVHLTKCFETYAISPVSHPSSSVGKKGRRLEAMKATRARAPVDRQNPEKSRATEALGLTGPIRSWALILAA